MQPNPAFRTSSFCPVGACLGVGFDGPDVVLSEMQDAAPIGPRIYLTGDEWAAFLRGAKAGEFDPPGAHAQPDVQ